MVSIDGYIEDHNGNIDWTKPGEELHRHFNELEKNLDINFCGRRMSEAMDYWLTADQNPELKDYEFEYARLLREVDPDEIREMKKQPGNDIAVSRVNLASTFINHGLIDEFRLYIHPVVLGSGKPMLPDKKLDLTLMESQSFPDGVMMLKYQADSTAAQV